MKRILLVVSLTMLAACYNEGDYNSLTGSDTLLVLRTEPASATLPADATARVTIVAQITPGADPAKRTILFETTAGTFFGGSVSGSGRTVTAGPEGRATIQLQSSDRVETAVVTATVQGVSGVIGRLEVPFVAVDPATVLRFTAAPASAPADGVTISTFVVQVTNAASLPTASRTVTFTTTAGTPIETSVTLDSSGSARALLRSPTTTGPARLRASVAGFIADVTINFEPARPEALTVTSDKFSIKHDLKDIAGLTVQLRRQVGTASTGTEISLKAADRDGNAIGIFSANPIYSDGTGKATTTLAVGTDYEGPVTITASVPGTNVSGTTVVQITKP